MKVPFYRLESVRNGSPFASLHHEWSPSSGARTMSGCHCVGETCHPKKVWKHVPSQESLEISLS